MKNLSGIELISYVSAIIALPVMLLVPIGVVIDRTYKSLPFAVIISLIVSACISAYLLIRFIRMMQAQ